MSRAVMTTKFLDAEDFLEKIHADSSGLCVSEPDLSGYLTTLHVDVSVNKYQNSVDHGRVWSLLRTGMSSFELAWITTYLSIVLYSGSKSCDQIIPSPFVFQVSVRRYAPSI